MARVFVFCAPHSYLMQRNSGGRCMSRKSVCRFCEYDIHKRENIKRAAWIRFSATRSMSDRAHVERPWQE
ncbi:MAG: hypothetical protein J0H31_11020, partial [Alphaproteobacteria bacterium]|nr:hypothetical protein [Alphaproteobacteria bacterium]